MTAGLPGTGIGGFFYLVSALWMPLREAGRALRGEGSRERWSLIGTQLLLAVGAIASACATGWLLAFLLSRSGLDHRFGRNLLRIAPLFLQAAVLGAVSVGVHVLRLLTRARPEIRAGGSGSRALDPWTSGDSDATPRSVARGLGSGSRTASGSSR